MGEVWRAYAALKRAVKRLDKIAKDARSRSKRTSRMRTAPCRNQ
jgi:hypothetical protein